MWILQQPAPGRFDTHDVADLRPDDLADGEVLIEFLAGGICGSDIPKFLGAIDPDNPCTGLPGTPLHELVGRVIASRDDTISSGDRVVGHVPGSRGLAERIIVEGRFLHVLGEDFSDIHATMIQPLSTVLSSIARVPSVQNKTVAVVGLGPLGLLFTHALKHLGAAEVIGIDRVDRSDRATAFGIDRAIKSESRAWSSTAAQQHAPPDLVIDAVGHRQEVVSDAINVVRPGGHVLVFGLPEDHYVLPMRMFFRKGLTLCAGANKDWHHYLAQAEQYLRDHRDLARSYISDVFALSDTQQAYARYALPAPGRFKVVLSAAPVDAILP